jgi:uncharacterized protein (DUF2236 family)
LRRRTARWDDGEITAADAMDFWAFAADTAHVIMQLSWPQVGHGVVESNSTPATCSSIPGSALEPLFSTLP